MNELEIKWIEKINSLYPNGYNITKGGKDVSKCDIEKCALKQPKKRGRNFGYKHKKSTILKMKERAKENPKTLEVREINRRTMSNTIRNYYDQKKIDFLSKFELVDDIEDYIQPVYIKYTKIIHDYQIRFISNEKKHRLRVISEKDSLSDKYQRLKNILIKVKKQNNRKLK